LYIFIFGKFISKMALFELTSQTSLASEEMEDGKGKVHSIVKNAPFVLVFTALGEKTFDLFELKPKLVYESNNTKEVGYIKENPLLTKLSISKTGESLSINVKINVLTSQQENSLFQVCVELHVKNKLKHTLFSEPVRVISKSDQVKKDKPKIPKPKTQTPKKRANVDISSHLDELADLQTEQSHLLEIVLNNNMNLINILKEKNIDLNNNNNSNQNLDHIKIEKDTKPLPFGDALSNLLKSYSKLSNSESKVKMRKLCINDPLRVNAFSEIYDFMSSNLQNRESKVFDLPEIKEGTSSTAANMICECLNCPHRKEIQRIENYYDEILFLEN